MSAPRDDRREEESDRESPSTSSTEEQLSLMRGRIPTQVSMNEERTEMARYSVRTTRSTSANYDLVNNA